MHHISSLTLRYALLGLIAGAWVATRILLRRR